MRASRLPASRSAPVASLPPRSGSKSGTFSVARSGTFSMAIDSKHGSLCRRKPMIGDRPTASWVGWSSADETVAEARRPFSDHFANRGPDRITPTWRNGSGSALW